MEFFTTFMLMDAAVQIAVLSLAGSLVLALVNLTLLARTSRRRKH